MSKNILIVDNEPVMHIAIRISLKRLENLNVYSAKNLEESLLILRTHSIDILVSDYNLDNESGLDVLKSVKMEFPSLKVIIMSGLLESGVKEDCLKFGAVSVFEKSNLNNDLLPEIARILEESDE